jgi:hypothetical protein
LSCAYFGESRIGRCGKLSYLKNTLTFRTRFIFIPAGIVKQCIYPFSKNMLGIQSGFVVGKYFRYAVVLWFWDKKIIPADRLQIIQSAVAVNRDGGHCYSIVVLESFYFFQHFVGSANCGGAFGE